jgi:hypothetical protein
MITSSTSWKAPATIKAHRHRPGGLSANGGMPADDIASTLRFSCCTTIAQLLLVLSIGLLGVVNPFVWQCVVCSRKRYTGAPSRVLSAACMVWLLLSDLTPVLVDYARRREFLAGAVFDETGSDSEKLVVLHLPDNAAPLIFVTIGTQVVNSLAHAAHLLMACGACCGACYQRCRCKCAGRARLMPSISHEDIKRRAADYMVYQPASKPNRRPASAALPHSRRWHHQWPPDRPRSADARPLHALRVPIQSLHALRTSEGRLDKPRAD